MTNFIWITTQKELIHNYPNAPDEVDFLRHLHRHMFKFKIYIEVRTDDRDIEFIMFKRYIDKQLKNKNIINFASCEMLSNFLYSKIKLDYPNRHVKIEVSEDGENGVLFDYVTNQ